MSEIIYHFATGCKPPRVDIRNYKVCAGVDQITVLPSSYELDRPQPIKNQGAVNSCVAHAISSIGEYWTVKDQGTYTQLSTAFPYGIQYSECGQDGMGMYLQDACKIVQKYGDMTYEDCPGNYEITDARCRSIAEEALATTAKANVALNFKIDRYYNCGTDNDIKYAVYNYGPVLGCVKWYNSFALNRETGRIKFDTNSGYGYHATVIYGWNEEGFLCQNSWGEDWGKGGCYLLPYASNGTTLAEAKAVIDYDNPENKVDPKEDEALVEPEVKYNDWFIKVLNFILTLLKRK